MHFQRSPQNWPDVLPHLPPWALLKAFDPSLLREAKGLRPDVITDYRHHDFVYPFDRAYSFDELKAIWRANFWRFVDGTYLAQYASHVDLIEELNEYTDSRMVIDKALLAPYLASARAAVEVWNSEFRGRTVTNPNDGGQGAIPAGCRLVICNSPVGNDVPREFYELAIASDSVLGVHPYTRYWHGVRDAGDWRYHSGRWAYNEAEYGIKPVYAFTECGPYAGSAEGWRHPDVLNGDVAALAEAMRVWAHDVTLTAAYRERRVLGPGAWFTSGHIGWEFYQMDTPELIAVADAIRPAWVQPTPTPRARVQDVSGLYQDPAQMRYAEWRQQGFTLGFYEVAIGLRLIRWAQEHHDAMRAAGYITGPYLALHEADDPRAQAAVLVLQRRADDDGPSLLDFERDSLTEPMLAQFCDQYDTSSRWPLWIYTRKGFWESKVPEARRARYAKYGLYLAAWPHDTPTGQPVPMDPVSVALRSTPPDAQPFVPAPWLACDAQQHTGQGSLPGYESFLDLGVYNGTEAQLRARFPRLESNMPNVTVEDLQAIATAAKAQFDIAQKYLNPPPPPAPVPLFKVRVTVQALNVRAGPAATYQDIGDVVLNQELDVWAVDAVSGWYKISLTESKWISGSASYSVRI